MRALFPAILMLMSVADGVLAADIPQPAPPGPPRVPIVAPPAVYNWTGFYLGINGGYGFGTLEATATLGALSATVSEDLRGPLAGGQFGSNVQMGNFVVGVEFDAQWSDIKNTGTVFGATFTDKIDWFGTARGRFGVAVDNVLLFGSAGLGYGSFTSSATLGVLTASNTESRLAWTAGGGVEVGGGPWSFKAEYLYLQSIEKTSVLLGVNVSDHVAAHVARAGINYRFGGNTVAARY